MTECCICDGCFEARDDERNRLEHHPYCPKHSKLIEKIIMLYKRGESE